MNIIQDQGEMNVLFVHSALDDAGLSPYAFRVYCHIARRANRSNEAWPGIGSMSKVCGLSESSIRRAIKELVDREMLIVKSCAGGNQTNIYNLTPKSFWIPLSVGNPCLTERQPLSVGHPKVIHENNPYIPELKNSGEERVPVSFFHKPDVEMLVLDPSPPVLKPKRGRPPKPTDPRHQEAVAMFFEMYQERFGSRYGVSAADGKNLKTFLQTFPEVTVAEMRETLSSIWSHEVNERKSGKYVGRGSCVYTLKDLVTRWNETVAKIKTQ